MSETRTGGPCPKCHGTGRLDEFGIGLTVVCDECGGAFDNEHQADEHGPAPVWSHPAVSALDVCHTCLGTSVVVNLGEDDGPDGHVIELPCPQCSDQFDQ
jgi:hypothetical protein